MQRIPEPAQSEVMGDMAEAVAYQQADFSEVNNAFATRIVELAGDREQADVIDLGTGPADIPARLIVARPQWHITAVDAAQAMLDLGRQRLATVPNGDRITLTLADATNLPFDDASFDVVVSNSLVHHLDQPEALWREIARLAKPGATIVIRDLARPDSADIARHIVETHSGDESDLLKQLFYQSLLAAYTPDEVRTQLTATGLGHLQIAMASDRHWDVYGRR